MFHACVEKFDVTGTVGKILGTKRGLTFSLSIESGRGSSRKLWPQGRARAVARCDGPAAGQPTGKRGTTADFPGRRRLRLGSFASDTAGQRRGAVWRRPSRGGATTATGTSPRRSSPAAAAVSSAGGAVLFLFLF